MIKQSNELIVSWNCGSDADFEVMNRAEVACHNKVAPEHRNRLFREFFSRVTPPIVCLQEVPRVAETGEIDAQRVKQWLGPQYSFICGDGEDTLVAWDTQQCTFKRHIGTPNVPGFKAKQNFTIVDITHKSSHKVLRVVSGHFQRFMDVYNNGQDGGEGTLQLSNALELARSDTKGVAAIIFGCDANVEPMHPRMQLLQSHAFTVDCQTAPTNFILKNVSAAKDPSEQFKKVDYLAVRSCQKRLVIQLEPVTDISLPKLADPVQNPSDHIPIVQKITIRMKSLFHR